MSTIYSRVSRVASWAGWCSPCEREDRPLVLTRSGPGGLTSWLSGLSDEDRLLLLTCRVCGQWQFVPAREEDDPEIVLEEDLVEVLELVAQVRDVPVAPVLPAPRAEAAPEPVGQVVSELVELLSGPPAEAPGVPAPAPAASAAEAPALPAPRVVAERILTVPEPVTLPAFSPEAVEAAARVLATARAQTDRTAAPRAVAPPAVAAPAVPVPTIAELPPVVGLPTGTRQVVLAAAS